MFISNFMYKLPDKFPNNLKHENLENQEIFTKYQNNIYAS